MDDITLTKKLHKENIHVEETINNEIIGIDT